MRQRLAKLLEETPISPVDMLDNLTLYLRRHQLTDLLTVDALYRMILDIPGVIMEFGVRYGRHVAAFTALRGVYEPYNPLRRIIGFDTFTGFPDISPIDQVGASAIPGRFAVPETYPDYLREVLAAHEAGDYFRHMTQRTWIIQGDVRETLPRYLEENEHTVIAMAYFDMDLYEPSRAVIDAIRPYLTKGSLLVFDELDNPKWPGENRAVRETFGLDSGKLCLFPGRSAPCYMRWGE